MCDSNHTQVMSDDRQSCAVCAYCSLQCNLLFISRHFNLHGLCSIMHITIDVDIILFNAIREHHFVTNSITLYKNRLIHCTNHSPWTRQAVKLKSAPIFASLSMFKCICSTKRLSIACCLVSDSVWDTLPKIVHILVQNKCRQCIVSTF